MELKLENVTKKYGEKVALDGFSYTFTPGIYGILGANGAGKSTMMNLITDNLPRNGGTISYDGTEVRKLGVDFRRILGYMTQQQGLYEGMTAESFLVYMARLKEIPRKEVKGQIQRVLEMTNLADVSHKKIGSFSGGMKQRGDAGLNGQPETHGFVEQQSGERIKIFQKKYKFHVTKSFLKTYLYR